jgi:hypothetical protein
MEMVEVVAAEEEGAADGTMMKTMMNVTSGGSKSSVDARPTGTTLFTRITFQHARTGRGFVGAYASSVGDRIRPNRRNGDQVPTVGRAMKKLGATMVDRLLVLVLIAGSFARERHTDKTFCSASGVIA